MNQKWIMKLVVALVAVLAPRVHAAEPSAVRNIVLILADDLGIKDLGCYGSDYYETPNCDRLAAEGMRFTEAYSAHSTCSPTRASILTGRYPARLHLTSYIPGETYPKAMLVPPVDWIKYLRTNEVTYAEAVHEAGFATCHVGKWHVSSQSPALYGFDVVTPARAGKNPQDPWFVNEYTTDVESFMEANRDRPFLVTLSHGTVHVPLQEKADLIEKYRKKTPGANGQNNPIYAAMVERMDWSVGRVLAKLKELGLEENTAVVFFSDNGGLSNVYDEKIKKVVTATSNLPYRSGKSQAYEGGIRVPLIIKWPGVTKPGSVCQVPVISTDLYPTFLAMAGLPLRPKQHLDGLSLAGLLQGGTTLERNCLYWYYPHYQTMPPHGAVRCGNWKLIEHYGEDARIEMFNLVDDPGETKDLVASYPERAKQLQGFLRDHLKAIGAQTLQPNPGYDASVPWHDECSGRDKYDPYDFDQENDPRQYVTDPDCDYGAGAAPDQVEPFTPQHDLDVGKENITVDANLPNVLLIGDSISIAYTPFVRELLAGQANVFRPYDHAKDRPINCGSTEVGLKELDGWLQGRKWDVIHFNWGLHDLCYRNPKETRVQGARDKIGGKIAVPINLYKTNLEQLVNRLEKTNAKLVWAATTRIPPEEAGRIEGDDVRYNAAAATIMKQHGIRVDDLYALTRTLPKEDALDVGNVHFNETGSRKIAVQVAAEIAQVLGQ